MEAMAVKIAQTAMRLVLTLLISLSFLMDFVAASTDIIKTTPFIRTIPSAQEFHLISHVFDMSCGLLPPVGESHPALDQYRCYYTLSFSNCNSFIRHPEELVLCPDIPRARCRSRRYMSLLQRPHICNARSLFRSLSQRNILPCIEG